MEETKLRREKLKKYCLLEGVILDMDEAKPNMEAKVSEEDMRLLKKALEFDMGNLWEISYLRAKINDLKKDSSIKPSENISTELEQLILDKIKIRLQSKCAFDEIFRVVMTKQYQEYEENEYGTN